ncbi:GntP family permease [Fulvivirga ligni]|uniref:GntP family permease n=1 Tax=Fulvivirga ligni TaxID=2904246 RepID=UPI001F35FD6A|nr:gluconate:H+ symporter [Fulvivirga ligni]UII20198.1 GntP family permease [Fulvivirga ligni]
MINYQLILAAGAGIFILLILIMKVRIQAFLALLITSLVVGILAGLPPIDLVKSVQNGMAGTLGFVATVVGLGSIFGALLEHSGGAQALANYMLRKFGVKNASWSMVITGFLVAIPVFFDVAFIILVPLVYALKKQSGKSILLYGIPLLAGLAITHAFIPPTPGPVAVADIVGADLGWVILFGFITGIPAAIVSGPLFARFIAKRIDATPPELTEAQQTTLSTTPFAIISIISIPILLILINTFANSPLLANYIPNNLRSWLGFLGHPFTALIIANLVTWYFLGIRKGQTTQTLMDISTKSLAPAGVIILITGAGGAFKQVLIDTGIGEMIANSMQSMDVPLLVFGFLIAAIVRILQGSSTVAMITAAGMSAPLIAAFGPGEMQKALLVISIASGATILSHLNDSGFWLVSRYFGLTENQTLKSWTVMTTLIALVGLAAALTINLVLP